MTVNSIAEFHSLIERYNTVLNYPIHFCLFQKTKPESEKYCLDSTNDDGILYKAVAEHPTSIPKWKWISCCCFPCLFSGMYMSLTWILNFHLKADNAEDFHSKQITQFPTMLEELHNGICALLKA